jgi:hypothetical protein
VRGLPTQVADGNGDFYAQIAIDERLPLGSYHLTASGVNSGRLVIADFAVNGGGPFEGVSLGQSDPAAPFVQGSNLGDGTLGGPTNLEGALNSVGPQITPQDTQGCANPENFWTPNC